MPLSVEQQEPGLPGAAQTGVELQSNRVMRLSELKTGERATVIKVQGRGAFRKRIVEMGFISGKEVEVLLNAPLQDPVKYRILGYEVSLRRAEAELIEVEVPPTDTSHDAAADGQTTAEDTTAPSDDNLSEPTRKKVITVALVGNPNCGKTSLFNVASGAHERVGNYSGVTVDAKEGHAEIDGYRFNIVDLPGTYSLSAYSPEELYVRRQLTDNTPDVVINVIDAGNIERNLYLTTQLIDMDVPLVGALNMYDEFEKRGDRLDHKTLGRLLGMPLVPTVFRSGRGVDDLLRTVIRVAEGNGGYRHVHLNHGKYIEPAISEVQAELRRNQEIGIRHSTRNLAIKLLEHDSDGERLIATLPNAADIIAARDRAAETIERETKEDSETAIMNAKYGIINGALKEAGSEPGNVKDSYRLTHALDAVITHKWLGFPLFFLFLYVMFQVTFAIGQYPMDWIEAGVEVLGDWLGAALPDGPVRDMLVDGVVGGVGAVIVFLPQILILYTFISFMEDSGYMARAAFIMDKLMHKIGLHGKSFIPMIMGFGCNVPAVMATRMIENRRNRLITMFVLPFMSCSARLPIYIMIVGTFFATAYQSAIMIALYAIGIAVAVVVSRVLSGSLVRGDDTPFVMELPPYRLPTAKATLRHTWEKGKQYLKKMGGIILVASIVVWALGYFPHDDSLDAQAQQEQSYIGHIGKAIEPVFRAQGFPWKLDVSLIAGVGAKEIVASTIGVLYAGDDSVAEEEDSEKYSVLYRKMAADGVTPLVAFAYLLFVLIYFPCIATIAAIKGETGSWRWALFTAVYTTVIAWCVSAVVYRIGLLF